MRLCHSMTPRSQLQGRAPSLGTAGLSEALEAARPDVASRSDEAELFARPDDAKGRVRSAVLGF